MIGNDVVDLKEAAFQTNWRRVGFMAKVFGAGEQQAIEKAVDKDVFVWLLWSMKEAAYKAHQRIFNLSRQVNWLDYECSVQQLNINGASGLVYIGDKSYHTSTVISSDFVHTHAVGQADLEVEVLCKTDAGNRFKTRLLELVSNRFNLSAGEVSLRKNSFGIPAVYRGQKEIFSSFSFSGHGRFYAMSLFLMES